MKECIKTIREKTRVKTIKFPQKYDTSLRLKRVNIVWLDAHAVYERLTEKEIKDEEEFTIIETVGFLVQEGKSTITVAQNAFTEEGEITYRNALWIPKVLVRTKKELIERDDTEA